MADILRQAVYNCRSVYNLIHGPEAWLAITAVCVFSAGIVVGMWLAALLGANGRDDDDR